MSRLLDLIQPQARVSGEQAEAPSARLEVFCSAESPEVFQSIVYQPQIWSADPFDVPTIHGEARSIFGRLVRRAAAVPAPTSGRLFMLHGEAGSGKTHLLRAFRTSCHGVGNGYVGYMQMTAEASNYGRYVLSNLISSLDQPYAPPRIESSGLRRLSDGLFAAIPHISAVDLHNIRHCALMDLPDRVNGLADRAMADKRFAGCDIDALRALIFLQRDEPQVKSKILKWLRCEDLSATDRRTLGDLVPRTSEEHPLEMVGQLGWLMYAVHRAALVICVDQLEDMFHQEGAPERFRKVVDTLVAALDSVPTAVVVIACLEDYYTANRQYLSRPKLDRLEREPEPVRLTAQRSLPEIEALVWRRLTFLYEEAGLYGEAEAPLYPFETCHLAPLANLSTRNVLNYCRAHQQRCIVLGRWVEPAPIAQPTVPGMNANRDAGPDSRQEEPPTLALEQAWNQSRHAGDLVLPGSESAMADLLAGSIIHANAELPPGTRFDPSPDGRMVWVRGTTPADPHIEFLVAVCEKTAMGGSLGRQISEVETQAHGRPAVLVRSTAFPRDPRTIIARQIGRLLNNNGRRVEVEDSDWRTLVAFRAFHSKMSATPDFAQWQREGRPLSQLASIRKILALDKLPPPRAGVSESADGDHAATPSDGDHSPAPSEANLTPWHDATATPEPGPAPSKPASGEIRAETSPAGLAPAGAVPSPAEELAVPVDLPLSAAQPRLESSVSHPASERDMDDIWRRLSAAPELIPPPFGAPAHPLLWADIPPSSLTSNGLVGSTPPATDPASTGLGPPADQKNSPGEYPASELVVSERDPSPAVGIAPERSAILSASPTQAPEMSPRITPLVSPEPIQRPERGRSWWRRRAD